MALVPVAGAFGPGAPCGFAPPEPAPADVFVVGAALAAPAGAFAVGAALTATVAVGTGATLPPGGSPVRVGAPLEGNGMGSGSGSGCWAMTAVTTTLPTTRITRSAASSAPHTTYDVRLGC